MALSSIIMRALQKTIIAYLFVAKPVTSLIGCINRSADGQCASGASLRIFLPPAGEDAVMTKSKPPKSEGSGSYSRALRALARMRRTGEPLSRAAQLEHVDPRTVRKYLGAELKRSRVAGRTVPTTGDRRVRQMYVLTSEGNISEAIRGSEKASQLGKYMAAVGRFLRTGDADGLAEFEGQSIAGHRLITDPDQLVTLAESGSVQIESIYALPEQSS
jgi:hypothetical protein